MKNRVARDVMTSDVRSVPVEMPLEQVAQLLAAHHISGMPVVDEQEHVVGLISEADLIDEKKREARIPRVALYGFFPVPEDVMKEAYRGGTGLKAQDVMTKKVVTAPEDAPLGQLAALMVTRRINRLPIVRDGKLIGIVSRADLVRALAEENGP